MPRTAQILLLRHIYHLTHRCHNGSFFLRFDIYRNEYRQRLWHADRRLKIRMLNYYDTSNHTPTCLPPGARPQSACSCDIWKGNSPRTTIAIGASTIGVHPGASATTVAWGKTEPISGIACDTSI